MKILLLGANGQLGQELNRTLPALGEVMACSHAEVDITDQYSVIEVIHNFKPQVIVNAAAYTAVDQAESERNMAFRVNAEATGILAKEAARHDIWLIHYSTDYVFDGFKPRPYTEADSPGPINIYGESKLAGEEIIAGSGCHYLIFRTTWVIGKDGNNFAKTILRLATEKDSLSIINDQFGVPTSPALIARVTINAIEAIAIARHWPVGLYHLAPHGETTWYGIAKTLLQFAEEAQFPLTAGESSLQPIKTADYPTPAKRPANSRLDTSKLEQQLPFTLPHWQYDFFVAAEDIIKSYKRA
ncbi:dTDP-4-dehydrorhamnose reductase [Salinisphaera sp. G21_0]|uniref:dTDP-4-dehydrorhamnose reductase n=1 Tax=Salinisphaera sp. G21_0 TaxID=2821094 RepID=UPI001ADB511C|nr:dTDP-4-dehydrorhamnose reductase [Salinisphaera sp. G21_0]MBO9484017.1 dTDP-4-dehydrorhamnose reductase [Salinisphaera sp. G21_0]